MMKTKKQHLFILFILFLTVYQQVIARDNRDDISIKSYNQGLNITPKPQELELLDGQFVLTDDVCFLTYDASATKIAHFFASKLKNSTGYTFPVVDKARKRNVIELKILSNKKMGKEAYLLNVNEEKIAIEASAPHGLFNGMQTLLQLLPAEIESSKIVRGIPWTVPCVKIKDESRFSHRGVLLDAGRHFLDVDFIKKQLDVMAMFKINKFHWHLTEDQGWRIEVKQYPKLTEIGSVRVDQSGVQYGPFFYTQDEVKQIVAYAKERFIEVIPEIELPGHSVAALAGYPELSCTKGPFKVRHKWGVSGDIYCAGNEDVFTFLQNVLDEVLPLFESKYVHIGGDEAPKVRWEKCSKCQDRIKNLGLVKDSLHTAEERLQSYFVQRMEKYIQSKFGRQIIGWDEILEGGLSPTATIMSWRGERGGIAAANTGHDVIMTPGQWLYVDKYQSDSKIYPLSMNGFVPLQKTYSYEPVPKTISEDKQHHIIGLQANMWGEHAYEPIHVENRLFPRAIAMAEVGWTAGDKKDYSDFLRRLENARVRMDMHNISYYIPLPEQKTPSCNFVAFVDETILELKTSEPVRMVYTIDGTEPTLLSTSYVKPLVFTESTTVKIRSVLPSGKMGETRTINLVKQALQASTKISSLASGIDVKYYGGLAWGVNDVDFGENNLLETTVASTPHETKYYEKRYYELTNEELFNTLVEGYINIPADDVYYFSSEADQVWIGGTLVINNENDYKRFSRADRSIALAKGFHALKIVRASGTYGGWSPLWNKLELSIRKSDELKFKLMDSSYFYRKE